MSHHDDGKIDNEMNYNHLIAVDDTITLIWVYASVQWAYDFILSVFKRPKGKVRLLSQIDAHSSPASRVHSTILV